MRPRYAGDDCAVMRTGDAFGGGNFGCERKSGCSGRRGRECEGTRLMVAMPCLVRATLIGAVMMLLARMTCMQVMSFVPAALRNRHLARTEHEARCSGFEGHHEASRQHAAHDEQRQQQNDDFEVTRTHE